MNLSRSGNALVLAFGVTAMIGTLVMISATSATQVVQHNSRRMLQLRCVAAVEAVLQRRESGVLIAAQNGSLLTWTGAPGEWGNFGEDLVGGCRVRWKIEPMRTLIASEAPTAPAALPYVSNPPPDPVATTNDADEVANTVTFLYRISAEAAVLGGLDANGDAIPLARAQGARAVSIINQPLFRFVIFYAADGEKGDLELSHGPELNITGSVYSNGGIYVGSNVSADDWTSLQGGSGPTTITGVNGGAAAVRGLDGIYRLSKPLMYAYYNNLPINNGAGIASVTDAQYDLTTASYPNETAAPNLSDFNTATANGTQINPRRVKAATDLIPAGVQARTINGIELSSDNTAGNDSRDGERPPAQSWSTTSSSTFARLVQSTDTGAPRERIDPSITGTQALDPQQLVRVELDGDPNTDEHAAYRPMFMEAGVPSATTLATQPIEQPGTYMAFALGQGLAMRRLADGTGWNITTTTGAAAGIATQSALIIRERPIPDTDYWPGAGVTMQPTPPNAPDYLPFAYGKHWRPSLFPAVPIDITENLHDTSTTSAWTGTQTVAGTTPYGLRTATDFSFRAVSYAADAFNLVSATRVPGDSTETMTASIGASGQAYVRRHRFHRDNWRFVHVKERHGLNDTDILALPQGLRAWVWANTHQGISGLAANDSRTERFQGPPVWSGLDTQVNGAVPWLPTNAGGNPAAPGGFVADYFAVRWDGYLVAPTQGEYFLRPNCDDGCRIWVDDRLVYERWTTGAATETSDAIPLSPARPSRIMIDYFEHTGSEQMTLNWIRPDTTVEIVPSSALRAAPAIAGFDRQRFQSVQALVDLDTLRGSPTGIQATQKVGLMLREGFGAANMLNGRDRYLFLGASPDRGIFVERRMQDATETLVSVTSSDFWVADGRSATIPGGPWIDDVSGNLGINTDRTNAAYTVERFSRVIRGTENVWDEAPSQQNATNTLSVVTETNVPATAGSIALDESTSISGLRYGAWTKQRTRTVTAQERRRKIGDFDLDFVTYRGVYPPSPHPPGSRPAINIFNDSSTATTTSVEWAWGVNSYSILTKSYSGVPGPALRRRVNGAYVLGAESAAKTSLPATTGSTNVKTIWRPSTGWPAGWTGAQVVSRLNDLGWGGGGWVLGPSDGAEPSTPNPSTPSFTLTELADPVTAATAPTNPITDANEHTFSVGLSNTFTLRLDTNSFISASGLWGAANVAQTRPWADAWTTLGLNPPNTRSFRPDLWHSAVTLPGTATTAIQAEGATAPLGGNPAAVPYFDDVRPAWFPTEPSVWLRMQHDTTTGAVTFLYARGGLPDVPGSAANPWIAVPLGDTVVLGAPNADPAVANDTLWSSSLLVGPAVQSGSTADAVDANVSQVAVATTETIGDNDGTWDWTDWEASTLPGIASRTSRYLASQYQVFFANQDITEDFFSFGDQDGGAPLAIEDWFYQTREFWSQARTWASGVEKDLTAGVYSHGNSTNRQLFAKTTVLRLNLGRIFQYLASRDLAQASTAIMGGTIPPAFSGTTLGSMFNGLIYAARTNRYPVNPYMESNPGADSFNPWTTAAGSTLALPNETVATRYADLHTATHADFLHMGVHRLQPYGLAAAPPLRPQDFHHGVMLENGSSFNWAAFPAGAPLGTGATSIVTPNHLYLRGDFNTVTPAVAVPNTGIQNRPVPVAVMGDTITLLSNAFDIDAYKLDGFASTNSGYSGVGILARARGMAATSTTYNTAIVTYNQPSTLDRVRERQSAAVVDTMQYLEDWGGGATMTYQGSLVVLGTKRYTESFLLNVAKVSGRSPFNPPAPAVGTWTGQSMQVYGAPNRVMNYNADLLTPQGTPPFTPNGVTTASLGGWVRVVQ